MLKEHTYVDDIAGSGSKLDEVREVTNSINAILNKGKFSMKAWDSNHPEVDQDPSEYPVNLGLALKKNGLALKKN